MSTHISECQGCACRGDMDGCLMTVCHSKETSGHAWLIRALDKERCEAIRLAAVTRTELEYARKARP